ncbi:MAG: glycosyltransferase [Thalassospira sp.]|uniref:glycosyltransferase n=1 Tax=Thalassospira sp. TaxID=1912094 RepID=UPI003A897FE8
MSEDFNRDLFAKVLVLTNTLIVVVPARISEWIAKGEISPGYFNPDGRFKKVLVVSLLPDQPSEEVVSFLCQAEESSFVSLDLLTVSGLVYSAGFSPFLVGKLIQKSLVPLLQTEESFVVRSYGDSFAGMFAALLGKALRCRSVASVHTTFTHIPVGEKISAKGKLLRFLEKRSRAFTHENIDALAPVYSPIMASIPERYHHKSYVIPNAVGVVQTHKKLDYDRIDIFKIVTVGRLVPGKSVMPVLEALRELECWELTIIGDGPCRYEIADWIARYDKAGKVRLVPSMKNDDLVASLSTFDVFAAYTAYAEVPKTVIEAGLVGLPIILNKSSSAIAQEYDGAPIIWVSGDASSYRSAFKGLGWDFVDLKELGITTRNRFEAVFNPVSSGKLMADLISQTPNNGLRPWNKD